MSSPGAHSELVVRFGFGVRRLREMRGWSQERLAEQANLNRSYIGEIERGCVIASLLTVEKLAMALTLSPAELLSYGDALMPGGSIGGDSMLKKQGPASTLPR